MARKNTHSHKMLDSVDISTSQTSNPTSVINMDKAGILVEWENGASPVGVITVEARYSPQGNFVTVDFGSPINVSGNSGNLQILMEELPYQDIRLVYTRTSGSADLTATLVIKQVGG